MSQLSVVELDRVRVGHRARRDLGDLAELMDSMSRHGLLNPITVTRDYVLIAGQRRLEAARRLGWKAVACRIVEAADEETLLQMEIEENSARKDFSSDELADALMELDRLRNPPWWRRLLRRIARVLRRIRKRLRRS